jgi:hypothetical protein
VLHIVHRNLNNVLVRACSTVFTDRGIMSWLDSAVQCSQTAEHNVLVRQFCTVFTDRRIMSSLDGAVQCSQTGE